MWGLTIGLVVGIAASGGEHSFIDSANASLERPDRIDPDEPRFEIAWPGLRARAMFGGHLGLWQVRHARFDFSLALSPFVELVNMRRSPVPWQSYRANVGLTTMWRPHLRMSGAQLRVEAAWHHHSDHAADLPTLNARFAPSRVPDNGNFSTYEYARLSTDWTQRWAAYGAPRLQTTAIATVRPYFPSINRGDRRRPVLELSGELRVGAVVTPQVVLWVGGYAGWVHNRFVPRTEGVIDTGGTPLDRTSAFVHRIVQAGATVEGVRADLSLFALYANSHSRGVDFFVARGHEFGLGLRMRL